MAENDYKYILDSLSTLQIGARFSYGELQDNIDVSYKFRCIIKQKILLEVDADTSLESHFYYMKPEDETAALYTLLKAKIRLYVPKEKIKRDGSTERLYMEHLLTPAELTSISPDQKEKMGVMISELQLSKLGLMTYAL